MTRQTNGKGSDEKVRKRSTDPQLPNKRLQQEIKKRASADETLPTAKLLLDAVISQSPVPMAVVTSDGKIEILNEAGKETLGLSDHEIKPGMGFSKARKLWQTFDAGGNLIPFEQSPPILALEGKVVSGKEMRIVRKDGIERWHEIDAVPIYNKKGDVIASFMAFPDITDRWQANESLRKAHAYLEQHNEKKSVELLKVSKELQDEIEERKAAERAVLEARKYAKNIVDTIRDPMVVLDADLKVVSASRSFYKTSRLTPAQIYGKLFYTINNNQWDIPKLRSLLEKILPKNIYFENFEIEHDFDRMGSRILHLNARRLHGDTGQSGLVLLCIEDVTARVLQKRKAVKNGQRHKAAAQLANIGHWELDLVTHTLFWSDEIYRMFELEPQEFGATFDSFLERVHPDDREFVERSYADSVKKKTGYDIVHRLALKSGRIKHVHEKCKTEYDEDGNPLRSLGTVQDITERIRKKQGFSGIIGRNSKMRELFEMIRELSDVNMPVLIQGESGTGKELIATAIHREGVRARKPFVPVNCSALPEGLLESELFGHVKGAFTGALRDKKGRFELAHGGTLFLDEIVNLPKFVQVKLLRVLQEGTFERVGDEKTISVDVRIISAANRDLMPEVKKGNFREDLYYRINVVPIHLPPLRERKNDIPLLVEKFFEKAAQEGLISEGLSREALAVMIDYSWPGNIRELQSAIKFALVKSRNQRIKPEHLPLEIIKNTTIQVTRSPSGKLSPENVRSALSQTVGNKSKAAKLLGVGRATLYRFLSEHPEIQ
ncbi:MAG: hypothetical protein DRI57_23645 [Deltaproteobacteria bacterium]|nr:MAG: hypothetical protein DRI57_23645 [Deltaproteobacteria bacterium]